MTLPEAELKGLLLDFLSPVRPVAAARVRALDDDDWATLLRAVRQHRVGPMLHHRLGDTHAAAPVPSRVRDAVALRFREVTHRSLVIQHELASIGRVLDAAGFAYVALKGAYLALHAYPQPGLRPLRDLDILVQPNEALAAYQALLDGGLARSAEDRGDPRTTLHTGHHLPPLRSPTGRVVVELHGRLFHRDPPAGTGADPAHDPDFWRRCIRRPVAGAQVPFASPADLLLHVIVHAVVDHRLDAGPLLLSDVAFLLRTHALPWPLFWDLAARGGHTQACMLALELTRRYWGDCGVEWPSGSAPSGAAFEAALAAAALLLLQSIDASRHLLVHHLIVRQPTRAARVAVLLRSIFPPRSTIARDYPVAEGSARAFLWYPARWWRIAAQHLPAYLRSQRLAEWRREEQRLATVERWLARESA